MLEQGTHRGDVQIEVDAAPLIKRALSVPRLQFTAPGRLELVSEQVPAPTGSQVRVRIHTVGICATDLSLYKGTYKGPHASPLCFGHEWSGVVEGTGPDVTGLREGDRVVGECLLACGDCAACARDPNQCERVRKFGITIDGAARGAALVDEAYLHRVDAGVDFGLMALAEPLAVADWAICRGASAHDMPLQDSRVLVTGGGMIGLGCVACLRLIHDCDAVALSEPVAERMALGRTLGATPAVGDYDLIFETSGSGAALDQALGRLRPNGTVVCVGLIESLAISPRRLTLRAGRLVGSLGGTGRFAQTLALVQEHGELLRPLITHTFAFDEFEQAFAATLDRERAVKVQLLMNP